MRRSAHVLRRCACRSALSHPHPSRTYTTTRAPAHPSTPAPAPASTRVASDPVTENDDWAFGGGAKSSGGPVGPSPSSSSGIPGKTVPLIVMGNAGKGAIPNYGKRKTNSITFSGSANPTEAAQAQLYHHSYSPSTRSEQPLPQHTYFSSPSSSFNASSFVTPGTQPPLGGTTTAGTGQGYPGSAIVRKKTALIMPGQGSQYVAMSKDLYKAFRSARTVWHQAEEALMLMPGQINHPGLDGEELAQRQRFEEELDRSVHLDYRKGLSVVGTGVGSSGMRRGWLRDLVVSIFHSVRYPCDHTILLTLPSLSCSTVLWRPTRVDEGGKRAASNLDMLLGFPSSITKGIWRRSHPRPCQLVSRTRIWRLRSSCRLGRP